MSQLTRFERFKSALPKPVKKALAPLRNLVVGKTQSELAYWQARHLVEGRFKNDWYERILLAIAGESDGAFLKGKSIADFGCGPRGSLTWAEQANFRFGIDVLAQRYAEVFPDDVRDHGMVYVPSTEAVIPMPDACIDIMFTLNALDHVANLDVMCSEICRILKPRGRLVGSFNLNESATAAEPQTLTEAVLDQKLLRFFDVKSKRLGRKGMANDNYVEMFSGNSTYDETSPGYLWFDGNLRA